MPWHLPVNCDPPIAPLTDQGVEAIHEGAMHILEEIGIEFLNPEACAILQQAGCTVRGTNVRMDRHFVMDMVSKAPSQWTITPRNPDRKLIIGGRYILFGNVSSPPNYWDVKLNAKVPGTRETCQNLIKLSQYFNCIHFVGGYPVEPVDLHASTRHLDVLYDKLTLSDKVAHAYSLGRERVEDVVEMVRLAGGWSDAEFEASPKMYTNINSTSPLKHDFPMLDGWMRLARRNQGLVVTPFTLAGAMAPVTLSGAVAQSIAEALCAVALAQWIRPGAACALGTFTSNVDMKTGAPAFGTPEYMRATQMTGQMARFYGLPLRSSGVCAANVPDGQAMWETSNSLWAAVQSGSNMVYHAAGWLEGGLIASPEKFLMDCEILQQIQRYMDPDLVATGAQEIALEAIKSVGNDGHFLEPPIRKSATVPPFTSLSYLNGVILKVGRRRGRFGRLSAHMRCISKSWLNLNRLHLRSLGGMRWRILLRAANVKAVHQPIFRSQHRPKIRRQKIGAAMPAILCGFVYDFLT